MDFDHMCPRYEAAIQLLGKRWTPLIIRVLLGGPRRFRDIKEQLADMSDRMLTERLRELENNGIVTRTVYPETPVRIEYKLTPKGATLEPVIQSIQEWAEKWMDPEPSKEPSR
jgi:DNA-binding HxlR family transcriptional regulator